jgi:WhiB family redox-sensing transcriptional regulator
VEAAFSVSEPVLLPIGPNILEMNRWRDRALCAAEVKAGRALSSWWFPDQGESRGPEAEAAKQICRQCEVRAECLEWAIVHREAGLWSATSERERTRTTGKPKITTCIDCGVEFVHVPRGGRQERCVPCRAVRDRTRKRAYDIEKGRIKDPGSRPQVSVDGGHGTISRYNKGCRCRACKKASQQHRARYLRAVS